MKAITEAIITIDCKISDMYYEADRNDDIELGRKARLMHDAFEEFTTKLKALGIEVH